MPVMSLWLVTFIIRLSRSYAILVGAENNTLKTYKKQHSEPKDFKVLAYQEEILMLKFYNKPYIYLCLQINCTTLGVKIRLFGIIYVSLSNKASQSNVQHHCISPLMLETYFPFIWQYFGCCKCDVTRGALRFS